MPTSTADLVTRRRDTSELRVVACPHPFSVERLDTTMREGPTIQEILASLGINPAWHARVFVDDWLIDPAYYARVRPRAGRTVTVRVVPRGGGGGGSGKQILGIVLMIAIAVVAWYAAAALAPVAAGLMGVTAAAGISAIGAGISIGVTMIGAMLVSALIPPQSPKRAQLASPSSAANGNVDSPTLSLTGTQNRANPYGIIPKIYGLHRVYPPLGAVPYTEIVGNDQYLRMLFTVGYGPLELTDLRIGDNPLSSFQDVETEIRQGFDSDLPLALYSSDVTEEPLSIALTKAAGAQIRTTPANPDEISVDVVFPGGLVTFDNAGNKNDRTVALTIEYKRSGDATWIAAPMSPVTITDKKLSAVRMGYRWPVVAYQNLRPSGDRSNNGWATAPLWSKVNGDPTDATFIRSPDNPNGEECRLWLTAPVGSVDKTRQHTITVRARTVRDAPDKICTIYTVLNQGAVIVAERTDQVGLEWTQFDYVLTDVEIARITDYTTLDIKVAGYTSGSTATMHGEVSYLSLNVPGAPTTSYVVRLARTTDDTSDPLIHDQVFWSTLRTVRATTPILLDGLATVALRIKATDQLNGVVQTFNCLAQSILPDWDAATATWITRPTQNPASVYRDVLQSAANARPVADARLDLAKLQAWHARNITGARYFNHVVDYKTTVFELLRDACAVGRAAFGMRDGKYSVVEDLAQTTPIQHFTPRNSMGFRGRKAFPDTAHALKVRFTNPEANWQQDERIVYADGYNEGNATKFEVLETLGVTDPDQAWKMARYHLAATLLRPELYELTVDVENLICERGDLVRVTYDVPLWGVTAGRITAVQMNGGNCSGVTVDEGLPMIEGQQYAARMRLSDGTSVVRDVVWVAGVQTTIVFATEISAPVPQVGDLLMFGYKNSESVACIVKGIEPDRDLTATLTLVDAAPAVLTADAGSIPPWQSFITLQPPIYQSPPSPVIDSVRSDETVLLRNSDGSLASRIVVALHYVSTSLLTADYVEARFRPTGSASAWTSIAPQPRDTLEVSLLPVEDGAHYDLRVRTATNDGQTSEWVEVLDHTVIGKTTPPPLPTNLRIEESTLRWDYLTPPLDIWGFLIRLSPGTDTAWDAAVPLHQGIVTETQFPLATLHGQWTLLIKAEDVSGLISSAPAVLTHDFGAIVLEHFVQGVDYQAIGYPGTIVNGTVGGGVLSADLASTVFWADDSATFWPASGATTFWQGTAKEMSYSFTFRTTDTDPTAFSLFFDLVVVGQGWRFEYDEGVGGGTHWVPMPMRIEPVAYVFYTFRITTDASPVRGVISTCKLLVDAHTVSESTVNTAISAPSGSRLPILKTYRAIDDVQVTVVSDGGNAASAAVIDKNAATGPLIMCFDWAGQPTAGHVDAVVKGY